MPIDLLAGRAAATADPRYIPGKPLEITVDSYRGAPKAPRDLLAGRATATASAPTISAAQFDDRFNGLPQQRPETSQALLQDFQRGEQAGAQGTSPIVRDIHGNLNYQPLGEAMQFDFGDGYLDRSGQPKIINPQTDVVLTDPESGKAMVYARSPDTNEGRISSAARLLLPGMATTTPARIAGRVAQAAEAAPEIAATAPGAVTGPAAGARLSSSDIVGAFDRSNITPTLPTVSRNRGVGGMAQALNNSIAGTPISRSFAHQADQAAARAEQIAATRSNVGQGAVAGERAQQGAEQFRDTVAPARQGQLYDRASRLINPAARSPLSSTRRAIVRVESMISNPDVRALVTDKNFTRLADVIKNAGRTGLSFDDLRQLRTQVRQLRPAEGSAVGINKVAVERIYDGLTMDMHALAQKAGGDAAVHAIRQADKYTRALETVRLPALDQLLSAKSGENAFAGILRMAQQGAGGNWKKLLQIKRSIGANAWDDISATVIREMGNPTPGAMTSVDLDQFSPSTFMTNFNKLSPQGKAILFGERTNPLRSALDDLSTAVGEMKRVQSLGNPSGTGRQSTAIATLFGIFSAPVATLGMLGTGHALSMLLTSPKFARWFATGIRLERAARRTGNFRALMNHATAALGRITAGEDQEFIDLAERLARVISAEAGERSSLRSPTPATQFRSAQ
jgi:hypothetical protein